MFTRICSRIISVVVVAGAVTCLASTQAAEVTLRMRGGTFEVKGNLQSHSSKSYILAVPGIGNLTLDASRYDCIGPNCPAAGANAPIPPLPAGGAPLTTTWIGGSAVGTEVMPRLVRAYAASIGATTTMSIGSDPRNLEFKVLSSDGRLIAQVNAYRLGVTPGFLALAKKEADLVWTGRRIVPEEQQMMTAVGIANMRAPGNEHVWALDGLVALVAKENPVEALSLEQLSKIFAGEITDWSELGFAPGKINLYAPVAEAPAWSQFEPDVMNPYGRTITPTAKRLIHSTEWADRVAEDPQGIVVSVFAMVRTGEADKHYNFVRYHHSADGVQHQDRGISPIPAHVLLYSRRAQEPAGAYSSGVCHVAPTPAHSPGSTIRRSGTFRTAVPKSDGAYRRGGQCRTG